MLLDKKYGRGYMQVQYLQIRSTLQVLLTRHIYVCHVPYAMYVIYVKYVMYDIFDMYGALKYTI